MKLFLLLSILTLCSCSRNEQSINVKTLFFDENNKLDINEIISYKFIPLETSDDCLINSIKQIVIEDNYIYVNSGGDKLLVFDISGKFIAQIGNKGNGPGEYRLICNFNINKEKGIISIADSGQNRIIYYRLSDYKHIKTKTIFYFVDCCWLSDGNIAWFFLGGYNSKNEEKYFIKTTDSQLNEISLLYPMNIELQYPIFSGSIFYTLNQNCYFNLSYIPIIYEVTSSNIIPVYQLDLGIHKFAPQEWIDREAKRNYSAIVNTDYISAQNVKETNNYVSVGYCAQGANAYIGFYNKTTGQSCKYALPEFIRHTGLTGVGIVKDTFEDYFITVLNSSILKRNPNSKIPELKIISENINEEDNPVLCLFKLK